MNQKPNRSLTPIVCGLLLMASQAAVQAQYDCTTNADGISITITGYTGPGGPLTIPTNINGLTVTCIGLGAFSENYSLTSVTIPGSVTCISNAAFGLCTNLTRVSMTNGLASIEYHAFVYCASLTNITIPGSVTNIGNSAFYSCTLLTQVKIPASVTNIGYDAFAENTSLTSVTIPVSFSSGDDIFYAFDYDPKLTIVTIDNGITSIPNGFFGGMYESDDLLASVSLPASVTNIADYAFNECSGLTNVTLSYGLTSIGSNAFGHCYDVTNLTIPASVTYIGASAFTACDYMYGDFFAGNAPTYPASSPPFDQIQTIYYLPGTTGWSNTYSGRPTVLWNPQIQTGDGSFGVQNNQFGFNITGTSNIPIVVEACANLASPVWIALQSLTLTNGLFYFSEPLQTNGSGRYYRISSP